MSTKVALLLLSTIAVNGAESGVKTPMKHHYGGDFVEVPVVPAAEIIGPSGFGLWTFNITGSLSSGGVLENSQEVPQPALMDTRGGPGMFVSPAAYKNYEKITGAHQSVNATLVGQCDRFVDIVLQVKATNGHQKNLTVPAATFTMKAPEQGEGMCEALVSEAGMIFSSNYLWYLPNSFYQSFYIVHDYAKQKVRFGAPKQ